MRVATRSVGELTARELQDRCKALGLSYQGTKQVLQSRLEVYALEEHTRASSNFQVRVDGEVPSTEHVSTNDDTVEHCMDRSDLGACSLESSVALDEWGDGASVRVNEGMASRSGTVVGSARLPATGFDDAEFEMREPDVDGPDAFS